MHAMQQENSLLKQQVAEKEGLLSTQDSQLSKKETELASLKAELEAAMRKIKSLEVSSYMNLLITNPLWQAQATTNAYFLACAHLLLALYED